MSLLEDIISSIGSGNHTTQSLECTVETEVVQGLKCKILNFLLGPKHNYANIEDQNCKL